MEEKYGEVEEMNVCDNLGDHLVGNVYVKVRERPPIQNITEHLVPVELFSIQFCRIEHKLQAFRGACD